MFGVRSIPNNERPGRLIFGLLAALNGDDSGGAATLWVLAGLLGPAAVADGKVLRGGRCRDRRQRGRPDRIARRGCPRSCADQTWLVTMTAGSGIVPAMGTKAERRAARQCVAAYHEAQLAELIEYIAAAVDRYRTGEIDAYDVDAALDRYHRAARELWKFCWSNGGGTHVEIAADVLDRMATDGETIDWWERSGARQRR